MAERPVAAAAALAGAAARARLPYTKTMPPNRSKPL